MGDFGDVSHRSDAKQLGLLDRTPASSPSCAPHSRSLNSFPAVVLCPQDEGWRPSITIRQILLGIQVCPPLSWASGPKSLVGSKFLTPSPPQELLDAPNPNSPAQSDAYVMFVNQRNAYDKRVRQQSRSYPPPV